jgi:hypothetical protein
VTTTLTAAQIQHEGLADWVLVVRALEARYETNGFATASSSSRASAPPPRRPTTIPT